MKQYDVRIVNGTPVQFPRRVYLQRKHYYSLIPTNIRRIQWITNSMRRIRSFRGKARLARERAVYLRSLPRGYIRKYHRGMLRSF